MSDATDFGSGGWQFTPSVVEIFDAHVHDHVPYYDVIQHVVAFLSDWLAPADALVADLGASTGTTVDLIERRHPDRRLRYALYDVEPTMLDAARVKHAQYPNADRFSYFRRDLTTERLEHEHADLTTALFALQFLAPRDRVRVLIEARRAARPTTGALIVAEKVLLPDGLWHEVANEATWDYKADAGIDADAIRRKARALRGVLVPQTVERTESEIVAAGWSEPVLLWRWYQWVVWVATAAT